MKRRIAAVTVSRSDYGIYYPLLRTIHAEPDCELLLIVAGAHLSSRFGNTVREIEKDGCAVAARVPMLLADDSPGAVAMSAGIGVMNFANAYTALRPDLLLLLGDRVEMLAAALAAVPLRIPIGHIHGGELTLGAIDDGMRHAISKLSHLHFVSTATYGDRLRQMGEERERIFVTGSPVIDGIMQESPVPQAELEAEIGMPLSGALLSTFHPATLDQEDAGRQVDRLLEGLAGFDNPLVFTYPGADAGYGAIVERVEAFVARTPRARLFINLGHRKYHSLLRYVTAMVGNSSSGMIEAASFRLPVVNIGDRQAGRLRSANVIDVPCHGEAIARGIERALDPGFRKSIADMCSPFGDGDASRKIVQVLKTAPLTEILRKRFCDLPLPAEFGKAASDEAAVTAGRNR
jgi:GDP/UDP-N,N'-diacetylbacillosamine 2-epimerase (hydrolysing)